MLHLTAAASRCVSDSSHQQGLTSARSCALPAEPLQNQGPGALCAIPEPFPGAGQDGAPLLLAGVQGKGQHCSPAVLVGDYFLGICLHLPGNSDKNHHGTETGDCFVLFFVFHAIPIKC